MGSLSKTLNIFTSLSLNLKRHSFSVYFSIPPFFFCFLILATLAPNYVYGDMAASKLLFFRTHGKNCGDVTPQDFYDIYPEARSHDDTICSQEHHSLQSQLSALSQNLIYPPEEISKRIFDEAARKQQKRDSCLIEIFNQLESEADVFKSWVNAAARAWLSYRKVKVFHERCAKDFWNRADRADINRYGLEEAWKKKYDMELWAGGTVWQSYNMFESLEEKEFWQQICLDEKSMESLQLSPHLYDIAVPLINTEEVFGIFDQHAGSFTNKSSGQPLSDNELLQMKLPEDFNKINIDLPPTFFSSLRGELNSARQNTTTRRDQLATTTAGSNNNTLVNPTNRQREYLFSEGILTETLKDHGLLETDIFGGMQNPSAAAVCILSDFENTTTGNIVEMLGLSLVGGSLALISKAGTVRNSMSALQTLKTTSTGALLGAFGPSMAQSIKQACIDKKDDSISAVTSSQNPNETRARHHMPEGAERNRFTIPSAIEQAPSCDSETSTYLHRQNNVNHCAVELIMSLGPEKIAMPLEFLN